MLRQAAVAVLLVGTAVSLTTVARRRSAEGRGHAHRCFLCEGEWRHDARCGEEPARLCPWCLAGSRADSEALRARILRTLEAIGPAWRGRHAHHCPSCLTTWTHRPGDACTAGDRAALPECPGCHPRPVALLLP